MTIEKIRTRVKSFEEEAHVILGKGETATVSRVYNLNESYKRLDHISIKQDDIFRQSLRCIESEVYRASIVLCFSGLIEYFQEYCSLDSFDAINSARPKWKDIKSLDQLREEHTESHLIDAMHAAKQITKSEKNALHGLRNRRNECAHPSDYFPDMNEALGYFSESIKRIEDHQKRHKK